MSLKTYDQDAVRAAYVRWYESEPFGRGVDVDDSLRAGIPHPRSQANGALMRISPPGIAAAGTAPYFLTEWAMQDAELTHIHPVCRQVTPCSLCPWTSSTRPRRKNCRLT